ncbi:UDP-N-acetylmuramate dehydrogenase [Auritidibacter ignavus]|uniref:UDP-N-acetylenolpyruvoylglucosamine reductase n=1 Tax=Auritidibacter ignavus TaxID=678932 RepID=A0AAJ6DBX6_9MICC|nr:UDP-N-acetylmuramate dehydrogenase [Auritidibacter ignavus]WGH93090.1 UDP-N-acetylmuramate dehydrogenase [Auritidibacter ignavus]
MSPSPITLAELTTSRVGGPAQSLIRAETEDQLIQAVTAADAAHQPLLVLGGGSNLLVADRGFPGTVVQICTRGIDTLQQHDDYTVVRVAAGETWDDFVAYTVEQGLSGVETLSGIPGLVGATPVQNVGAYGADISESLQRIRALDRETHRVVELAADELDFGYRDSVIKRSLHDALAGTRVEHDASPRWIVLSVDFHLKHAGENAAVRYGQLAKALDVELGSHAGLHRIREEVIRLRTGKGMVLDPADHDTWSTGSFFTNPIVPVERTTHLPEAAPRFGAGDGMVKLSAAWLIDHAGFHKGFHLDHGRASLSTKHTLALTNRGEASTEDLLEVARTVRDGVLDHWGIELRPEPVLVGVTF